jgi:hypothetical protein
MDVMSSHGKTNLRQLIVRLQTDFPKIIFEESTHFKWNADKKIIFYSLNVDHPIWSLLHELGHMKLAHTEYLTDVSLLHMETAAWQKAKELGCHYGFVVDEEYVQDCIDSYREWLHQRSTCPTCSQTGLEDKAGSYICINCKSSWHVTPNRLGRVYRKIKDPSLH